VRQTGANRACLIARAVEVLGPSSFTHTRRSNGRRQEPSSAEASWHRCLSKQLISAQAFLYSGTFGFWTYSEVCRICPYKVNHIHFRLKWNRSTTLGLTSKVLFWFRLDSTSTRPCRHFRRLLPFPLSHPQCCTRSSLLELWLHCQQSNDIDGCSKFQITPFLAAVNSTPSHAEVATCTSLGVSILLV